MSFLRNLSRAANCNLMRIQWRLKDLRELARDAAGKSSSCFGSTTRLADADKKYKKTSFN